jgi:hypothetical protein
LCNVTCTNSLLPSLSQLSIVGTSLKSLFIYSKTQTGFTKS